MDDGTCYSETAPDVNRLLKTLSSPSRRAVIQYFESQPQADTDSIPALVSHLDERMPAATPTEVEVALHHRHLPKLDDRGWIDYDPDEETIHYHGKEDAGHMLSELATEFSE